MILEKHLTIIEAWNELNRILNHIQLLETQLASRLNIKASKLQEVMVQCSIVSNNGFINAIASKDEDYLTLQNLRKSQEAYERYIMNEIKINKLSQPALCVAFLKEYYLKKDNKKMSWDDIADEMGYSIRQCKRYYSEYKGLTPSDNTWKKDLSS